MLQPLAFLFDFRRVFLFVLNLLISPLLIEREKNDILSFEKLKCPELSQKLENSTPERRALHPKKLKC